MPQRKNSGRSKGKSAAAATAEAHTERTKAEVNAERVERARRNNQKATERYKAVTAPVPLGPLSAVQASPADVIDELEKGGLAFGAYSASGGSSARIDSAAGSLHMETALEPRPDMQIPAPLIPRKGRA